MTADNVTADAPVERGAAIVTGGGGGIGRAIAEELAARGHPVAVLDIDGEAARGVAGTVEARGAAAHAWGVDVTDRAQVGAAVEEVADLLGPVEVLVNAAGFPRDRRLADMSDDDWHAVVDVCLFGSFATARAAAPAMAERGYGRIVNISSRAHLGNPGQANYSAAKAGVVGLTRSLAKELGRKGITVNAVAPGLIETDAVRAHPRYDAIAARAVENTSVPRLGVPSDVAAVVGFLASPAAGYVTGEVIHVSGGRRG